MTTLVLAFFHYITDFISNHELGCAFVAAVMVAALPKPGTKWNTYEYVYTVLNGLAANLPHKSSPYIQTLGLSEHKEEVK